MTSSSLPILLQATSDRLNGLFDERERLFLAIGQSLGDAITQIGKVTNAFETLPSLLENSALRRAAERISGVARTTDAIRHAVTDENVALIELVALNGEIAERLMCLQRSIRTIAILTSNAKIEAARVEQGGGDFFIFTTEIAQLAKQAQDTVDVYMNEQRKLALLLSNVRKAQTQFQHKYSGTLVSISEELDATLAAVDARRSRAAASAGNIAARSKRINAAIGTAVMALQISDTTRQRIEHVHLVLEHIRDGFRGHSDHQADDVWSRSLTEAARDDVAGAICRLQSVQLDDALLEYEETVGKVYDSLAQLVDECRGVASEGSDVYGSTGQETESFLEVLKNKLRLSVVLIHDCQIARSSATHATAIVATTVRQLQEKLSSIDQIVVDMTLVGMNAALKSRQLGNLGRGLGIIADELRVYATQTAKGADALRPALASAIGSAEGFCKTRLSQDEDKANLDEELAAAMKGLGECATKLNEALSALSCGAKQVGKVLEVSAARIDEQKGAPAALHQAQLELDLLAKSRPHTESGSAAFDEMTDLIWGCYTMARERAVHEKFLETATGVVAKRVRIMNEAAATFDDADLLKEFSSLEA
jgi:hypothetical protein